MPRIAATAAAFATALSHLPGPPPLHHRVHCRRCSRLGGPGAITGHYGCPGPQAPRRRPSQRGPGPRRGPRPCPCPCHSHRYAILSQNYAIYFICNIGTHTPMIIHDMSRDSYANICNETICNPKYASICSDNELEYTEILLKSLQSWQLQIWWIFEKCVNHDSDEQRICTNMQYLLKYSNQLRSWCFHSFRAWPRAGPPSPRDIHIELRLNDLLILVLSLPPFSSPWPPQRKELTPETPRLCTNILFARSTSRGDNKRYSCPVLRAPKARVRGSNANLTRKTDDSPNVTFKFMDARREYHDISFAYTYKNMQKQARICKICKHQFFFFCKYRFSWVISSP